MPDDSDDSIIFLDDSPVKDEVGTLQSRAQTREFQIATSSRDSDDVVRGIFSAKICLNKFLIANFVQKEKWNLQKKRMLF